MSIPLLQKSGSLPENTGLAALIRTLNRSLLKLRMGDLEDATTGTWTPTDASGAALTLTITNTARWTRHGSLVVATFAIVYPVTVDVTNAKVGGLPFPSAAGLNAAFGGIIGYTDYGAALTLGVDAAGATTLQLYTVAGVNITNAGFSAKILRATMLYEAA